MNPIEKDPLQKRLELTNWIILGALTAVGFVFMPLKFALGMLIGGFISILNFHWLVRDLRKAFKNLTEKSNSLVMFKYYVRFGVTAVALYFIIAGEIVDVIGLVVGLSTVVIAIVITTIALYTKKNCVEEAR
ncbi:MAG TPA: ATP synthase subunit I [Syntrophales bacterium]|nr:ATP synthase subunit I [Syntrophales bacterium]